MFAIPSTAVPLPGAEKGVGLDPASFNAFYDAVLPGIYGYFLRRCGGVIAVAEDLTQETFLAAVKELQRDKDVASPVAWIYGIARHKLLDQYRKQERLDRPVAVVSEAAPARGELVMPEDETGERTCAALAAVAASQRSALVLCYVDGYSVPEAARLLGKSAEAVESLLARGRRSFKRAYLEDWS